MYERYIDRLPLIRPQLRARSATQVCALTGNRTSDLLVRKPVLNALSHTSQGPMNVLTFTTRVQSLIQYMGLYFILQSIEKFP